MDDLEVEVDATDLVEFFDERMEIVKNLPMELYAQLFLTKVDEMFETQGAAGTDGPWPALSEETLRRHPRRQGGMILQDTGATAAGVNASIEGENMQFYSATAYGRHHLGGTSKMPKRDFFAINYSAFLDEIGELVVQEFPA